jgi:anti-sigma B factor antagonist
MPTSSQDVLSVEQVDGISVVTILVHELNTAMAEELSSQLLALLNDAKSYRFLIDFEAVQYMESACFGGLVTFLKWLSRFNGKVALANVSENVRFLFAITKLDRVFPLFGDVHGGLRFLGAKS